MRVFIEERQLGARRWRVMIQRAESLTLWEAYATQKAAEAGREEARQYVASLPSPLVAQAQDMRRENQALMQRAIDNYEAAEEGSAAKAYAGGQVRAHQQVDAFLLRRT